jgi:hypothetical protein
VGQNLDKGKRVQRVSTPPLDDISFIPPDDSINIASSNAKISSNVFVLKRNYILLTSIMQ